jgi:hypothetical protein
MTLLKALVLLVPAALLFSYSLALFKRKSPWSVLQLVGSTDVREDNDHETCEALRLFPWRCRA